MWGRNPLLSSDNFTQGHLVKKEGLVADVTAVRSLDRAECAVLLVILAGRVYGQSRLYLWLRPHFVMREPPLEQSGTCYFGGDFGWACFFSHSGHICGRRATS